MDINSQQLAIAGLLKKIRSNKSLTEDEVAEQAAKAVREHWQTWVGGEWREYFQILAGRNKSLMYYRIGAVHTLTGGRRTLETQLSAADKSEIWVNISLFSLFYIFHKCVSSVSYL